MPVFFRPRWWFRSRRGALPVSASGIVSATFAIAGTAATAFVGHGVIPGVLSAAGAATDSAVGGSTAVTTHVSAGVATTAFTGHAVTPAALSAAGTATKSLVGVSLFQGTFTMAGTASASFGTELRQIVSTNMIQKPVNCVLAGDQAPVRPGRFGGRSLRRIFNE